MFKKLSIVLAVCATTTFAQETPPDAALTDLIVSSSHQMGAAFGYLNTEYGAYAFSGYNGAFESLDLLGRLSQGDGAQELATACRAALASDDKYVRFTAAIFLRDIDGAAAVAPFLLQMYKDAGPDDVYSVVLFAASEDWSGTADDAALLGDDMVGALTADLRGDDAGARLKAARFVVFSQDERTKPLVLEALKSPDAGVRRETAAALPRCYFGDDSAKIVTENLTATLNDADAGVRRAAAAGLGDGGDPAAAPALIGALKDPDLEVRRAGALGLYAVYRSRRPDDEKPRKEILKALKGENDKLTRVYLAVAYGYAAPDKENTGVYYDLTPNGYWAFFTGTWDAKELDGYYQKVEGYSGGG